MYKRIICVGVNGKQ